MFQAQTQDFQEPKGNNMEVVGRLVRGEPGLNPWKAFRNSSQEHKKAVVRSEQRVL